MRHVVTGLAAALALAAAPSAAQEAAGGHSSEDLAKQLANPVSSLISVPFQFNYDGDLGPGDRGDRLTMNVQPVAPFQISEGWNLITRTIVPVILQDDVVPGEGTQFGLGDTTPTLFFSPINPGPGGIIWGAGPVFLLPTATESTLGTEKWGIGPSAVVLKQFGPWTTGALVNHVWSVAGDDSRADISQTFLQPFLNYTTPGATTFFLNTESTYDWKREEWAVPINAGVNQLIDVGGQKMQLGAGVRYWADSAPGGPEGFGARVNVVFLFPK